MKCINCQKETSNPKFCSRSCAAIFNNKSFNFPKRKAKGWVCKRCHKLQQVPAKNSKVCDSCVETRQEQQSWKYKTMGDLRKAYTNHGLRVNVFSYIREISRRIYSPIMKKCVVCGYDVHVHICHIKQVASFPDNTLISEVNAPENIVALCPNHHWELDHGTLSLPLNTT